MIFCSTCGARIEDESSVFCPRCGSGVSAPVVNNVPNMNNAPMYGQQQPFQNYAYVQPPVVYPMKWFKFLIYFALFFSAILNLVNGLNYITGDIYFVQSNGEATAEMVYNLYGDTLKSLDLVFGVGLVAVAAFSIYTRFRLAKYKANAPMCVYILYGMGGGLSLLYNIASVAIVGLEQLPSEIIVSLGASLLLVILNYIYFTKRKALFNN